MVVWLSLSYLFYLRVKKEKVLLLKTTTFQDIALQINDARSHSEVRSIVKDYKKANKLTVLFKKALKKRSKQKRKELKKYAHSIPNLDL